MWQFAAEHSVERSGGPDMRIEVLDEEPGAFVVIERNGRFIPVIWHETTQEARRSRQEIQNTLELLQANLTENDEDIAEGLRYIERNLRVLEVIE